MAHDAQLNQLRLLTAELQEERSRVERLIRQFPRAEAALEDPNADALLIYGAAALLRSFMPHIFAIMSSKWSFPTGGSGARDAIEQILPVRFAARSAGSTLPHAHHCREASVSCPMNTRPSLMWRMKKMNGRSAVNSATGSSA